MRYVVWIICLLSVSPMHGQSLIGTPNSLILVYNLPNNHFYLELLGKEKKRTEQENVFIIDNQVVQVLTVNVQKFLDKASEQYSDEEVLQEYVSWEKTYMESSYRISIVDEFDLLRTATGRKAAYWTYDMPMSDSNVQKQMFVIARVKNYIVGINCPVLKAEQKEATKKYLLSNIDRLVEWNGEIDLESLNKSFND